MTTENTEAMDTLVVRVSGLRDSAAIYVNLAAEYATKAATHANLAADYAKSAAINTVRADEAQGDLDALLAVSA